MGDYHDDIVTDSIFFRSDSHLDMALIPAGSFNMGLETDIKKYFSPLHVVDLDTFQLDRYEVMNAQYRACVEADQCKPPQDCDKQGRYNATDQLDHPVVCVSWHDADRYCHWANKRLPTEAEWEKAARGTAERTNIRKQADWTENLNRVPVLGETHPVGSQVDEIGPYGNYDMIDNALEWVADWYDWKYYQRSPQSNPQGPDSGKERVIRGGWVNRTGGHSTAYYRNYAPPDTRRNDVGFRCARTPVQAEN